MGFTLNKGAVYRWILGQAKGRAKWRMCQDVANMSDVASFFLTHVNDNLFNKNMNLILI